MKILTASQIREWDQYTIDHEPITSIDLMERAASRCVEWLMANYPAAASFNIFCGKGNNGGDGLAIARMLIQRAYEVTVHILEFGHKGTDDFQANLARLHSLTSTGIHFIQTAGNFPRIAKDSVVVDAIFGSGLNMGLEGITAELVSYLNNAGAPVVSIDIPTGLSTDQSSKAQATIKAAHTLGFQCFKPAFLYAENAAAIGQLHLLQIGLHPGYYESVAAAHQMVDAEMISSIYRPRQPFAHKGNFGHALLLAGSYGKIGAAVLAAKACLKAGAGLLTCQVPACGYEILQTSLPEAMVVTTGNEHFLSGTLWKDLNRYNALGIGPGIGTEVETRGLMRQLLHSYKLPMVIDADGLNILASEDDLLPLIPAGSILTPHPKEFERLFGKSENDFNRVEKASQKAEELNCIMILKGHYSFIAFPQGFCLPGTNTRKFFNSTGNAGMAKGGTGDVLTGIITSLLAQGYSPAEAAIIGVYLHGLAGDIAAKKHSMESMLATDLINCIGEGFRRFSSVEE
jgi:hydroxyethylthiazole kinase-like uncharacterized protein yjeF